MCSQITPFPNAQPRFHVKVEDFEPQGFTYLRTLARANVAASTTSGVVAGAAAKVATTIAATKEVRGAMVEAALSQPVLLTVPATDGAAATLVQVLTMLPRFQCYSVCMHLLLVSRAEQDCRCKQPLPYNRSCPWALQWVWSSIPNRAYAPVQGCNGTLIQGNGIPYLVIEQHRIAHKQSIIQTASQGISVLWFNQYTCTLVRGFYPNQQSDLYSVGFLTVSPVLR